jgi:Ca2+/H+ antiporter, TMEM165/GDT1 family
MDALIPAFIAAALAEMGDKSPWLAAILAARFGRAGPVLLGIFAAAALASALSAAAGALVQPMMTPNARLLFLALALVVSGVTGFFALRRPDPLANWRIGAFATTAIGLFVLQFGEGTQFLVAGLAANAKLPAMAALGATLGICAVTIPMALAGIALRDRLPIRAMRIIPAILFLATGLWAAVSALRLI